MSHKQCDLFRVPPNRQQLKSCSQWTVFNSLFIWLRLKYFSIECIETLFTFNRNYFICADLNLNPILIQKTNRFKKWTEICKNFNINAKRFLIPRSQWRQHYYNTSCYWSSYSKLILFFSIFINFQSYFTINFYHWIFRQSQRLSRFTSSG